MDTGWYRRRWPAVVLVAGCAEVEDEVDVAERRFMDAATDTPPVSSGSGATGLGKTDKGHGNNLNGVDVSNPGKGKSGPNGTVDPSGTVDDEGKGQKWGVGRGRWGCASGAVPWSGWFGPS